MRLFPAIPKMTQGKKRTLLSLLACAAATAWGQAAPIQGTEGARESAPAGERGTPSRDFRAFDDSIYGLAYDVFLAAGNMKEAYSLASEAVRQVPGNDAWRERLAKTAEWSGNPRRAFKQWEHLCGHRRDDAPFREAVRLATALRDHEAAVRIWEGWSRFRELEDSEWVSLLHEYEESGEPRRGIERLRARIRTRPDSVLMDNLAGALIRTGSDLEALDILRQLADRFGNSPSIAFRRAEILCQRGNLREAGSVLETFSRSIPTSIPQKGAKADTGTGLNLAYRRLEASIHIIRQEYGEAMAAYRDIFASGVYEIEDLRELVVLAKPRDSTLALLAAVEGWKRYAYPDFFVYYLERCIQADRWDLASRALANLSPDGWALFKNVPYFLSLSSRIHQHEGRDDLARRELLDALRLDPESDDLRAGLLWLFIDQGRIEELEAYVAMWDMGGESEDMLEPLAMAHKLLQHNRLALDYFRRLDRQGGRKDLLFLFSYADLLEQAGDGEGMRVIYARISDLLKTGSAAGRDPDSPVWKQARARWAWKFGGSEEAARRMKDLLDDSTSGEAAQELAFSWKLGRGENPEDALAQLASASVSRPGGEPNLPPWAELAVAMRRNDAMKVSDLLEKRESSLSPVDRATAADFLGLRKRSLGYVRESYGSPLSPRQGPIGLGSLIWGGANTAGGSFDLASHPLYLERRTTGSGRIGLGGNTALGLALERRERPRLSPAVALPVPEKEDAARLELSREGAHGSAEGNFGIRSVPDGSFHGRDGAGEVRAWTAGMSGEWRPLAEVSMELGFALNHSADENPVLSLGALKDEWKGSLGMKLPLRSRGNLAASYAGFHDRSGRRFGSGSIFRAEWIHRPLRPLALGLGASYNGFNPAAVRTSQGKPLIAGVLALNEFPQSFWKGSAHFEWLNESPESRSAIPSPFLSGELERSFFPSLRERAGSEWVNAFALRAGFSLFPTRAQRLSLAASVSRGVQLRAREETRVTTRYEYFFK